MLLTAEDRTKMSGDVGALIEAFTETAEIIRPTQSGVGSFSGIYEPEELSLGTIPIEFKLILPDVRSHQGLKQLGADGVCSLLPDTDIQEGDILVYQNVRYRVTDVKSENCFGAKTHLIVRLERIYKNA